MFIGCYEGRYNWWPFHSDGYFFKSYEYDEKSGTCKRVLFDYIAYESALSHQIAFEYDESWTRKKEEGCPKYFGEAQDDKFLYLDQYHFSNEYISVMNEGDKVLGETVIDEKKLEKMKSCSIEKNNNINCSNVKSIGNIESYVRTCVSGQLEENHSEQVVDEYMKELADFNKYLYNSKVYSCDWKEKCKVTSQEFSKYQQEFLYPKMKNLKYNTSDVFNKTNLSKYFKDADCILGRKNPNKDNTDKINERVDEVTREEAEKSKNENEKIKEIFEDLKLPEKIGWGDELDCETVLGKNLEAVLKIAIVMLKIAGIIICLVKMMLTLIPPIVSKNTDALPQALKTCAILLGVCVAILLIDTLVNIIGNILGYDLSCIF